MSSIDNLFQESLSSKLNIPSTIYLFDEIDSTNDFLKNLNNKSEPIIVISRKQTKGKGQNGKSFFSPVNGLYFSFRFKHLFSTDDLQFITSAVAVAVVESIEKIAQIQCRIKWVNDIILNNKKIAGILTETKIVNNEAPYVIVGIGINVFPSITGFPKDLIEKAGTIYNKPVSNDIFIELIAEIFNTFFYYYSNLHQKKHIKKYQNLSMLKNKTITFMQNGHKCQAKVLDIDNSGNLIVKQDNITTVLSSGSISIDILN